MGKDEKRKIQKRIEPYRAMVIAPPSLVDVFPHLGRRVLPDPLAIVIFSSIHEYIQTYFYDGWLQDRDVSSPFTKMFGEIKKFDPDIVFITGSIPELYRLLYTAYLVKTVGPSIITVLSSASPFDDLSFLFIPEVDLFLDPSHFNAALTLVKLLTDGQEYTDSIPGLYSRNNLHSYTRLDPPYTVPSYSLTERTLQNLKPGLYNHPSSPDTGAFLLETSRTLSDLNLFSATVPELVLTVDILSRSDAALVHIGSLERFLDSRELFEELTKNLKKSRRPYSLAGTVPIEISETSPVPELDTDLLMTLKEAGFTCLEFLCRIPGPEIISDEHVEKLKNIFTSSMEMGFWFSLELKFSPYSNHVRIEESFKKINRYLSLSSFPFPFLVTYMSPFENFKFNGRDDEASRFFDFDFEHYSGLFPVNSPDAPAHPAWNVLTSMPHPFLDLTFYPFSASARRRIRHLWPVYYNIALQNIRLMRSKYSSFRTFKEQLIDRAENYLFRDTFFRATPEDIGEWRRLTSRLKRNFSPPPQGW